jgi:hypothetical protein
MQGRQRGGLGVEISDGAVLWTTARHGIARGQGSTRRRRGWQLRSVARWFLRWDFIGCSSGTRSKASGRARGGGTRRDAKRREKISGLEGITMPAGACTSGRWWHCSGAVPWHARAVRCLGFGAVGTALSGVRWEAFGRWAGPNRRWHCLGPAPIGVASGQVQMELGCTVHVDWPV